MCLNFEHPTTGVDGEVDASYKQNLILSIAESLEQRGMSKVDTSRVTARIPVLQFVDPLTGLDCDICVNNQLALRNTTLLKSYSLFDERVRLVAYVVKTWSKRRDLNCPERSTLSSYGFLLTLFMHLQRRVLVIDRMLGENHPLIKKQRHEQVYHRPLLAFLQQRQTPGFGATLDKPPPQNHHNNNLRQQQQQQQQQLPMVWTTAPDGTQKNTYFYDPVQNEGGQKIVQAFAKQDTRSCGELLLSYFYYYAFEFDWRRQVVSIVSEDTVLKEEKSKLFGWKRHARLSIEDPFESR